MSNIYIIVNRTIQIRNKKSVKLVFFPLLMTHFFFCMSDIIDDNIFPILHTTFFLFSNDVSLYLLYKKPLSQSSKTYYCHLVGQVPECCFRLLPIDTPQTELMNKWREGGGKNLAPCDISFSLFHKYAHGFVLLCPVVDTWWLQYLYLMYVAIIFMYASLALEQLYECINVKNTIGAGTKFKMLPKFDRNMYSKIS